MTQSLAIKITSFCFLTFTMISFGGAALAVTSPQIQTNFASNVQGNSATLSSNLYDLGGYTSANLWFQWGIDTNYGNTTNSFNQNYTGTFTQQIYGLSANQGYHFRAIAQNSYGISYGQDMYFTTSASPSYYSGSGNGTLSITQIARNLSSGSLTWSQSVNANPLDVIEYSIVIMPTGNQTIHSVTIRDFLPENLVYNNNLTIDGVTSSNDITQGIMIGDLLPGQTKTITYRAQVTQASNFSYGQTRLVDAVSAVSPEAGMVTANTIVYVSKSGVLGAATSVSTGWTDNLLEDSFLLPLMLILFMFWFRKSVILDQLIDWARLKFKKL